MAILRIGFAVLFSLLAQGFSARLPDFFQRLEQLSEVLTLLSRLSIDIPLLFVLVDSALSWLPVVCGAWRHSLKRGQSQAWLNHLFETHARHHLSTKR